MTNPINLGDKFLGPSKSSVTTWPDPEIGWHEEMTRAIGVEGYVTGMEPNQLHLHFPSIDSSWWYTEGAVTSGINSPKFHQITVEGKSYWITPSALSNIKCELGIE